MSCNRRQRLFPIIFNFKTLFCLTFFFHLSILFFFFALTYKIYGLFLLTSVTDRLFFGYCLFSQISLDNIFKSHFLSSSSFLFPFLLLFPSYFFQRFSTNKVRKKNLYKVDFFNSKKQQKICIVLKLTTFETLPQNGFPEATIHIIKKAI